MKAYLSGAMEFAKNEGANWREEMTLWLDENLAHSVYNPVVESQSIMKEYGARITGNGKIVIPKNMQISSEYVLIEISTLFEIVWIT